ncbi:hypothetical protein [uncultured Bacteroides sp.]|uniref:hypothetical protein n=1 Tax=uncultured Bacteroides sp. TaxID=162156 RepID=UPI002618FE97|nr:hypothetical protein [uncultured Bacteroides sp.]
MTGLQISIKNIIENRYTVDTTIIEDPNIPLATRIGYELIVDSSNEILTTLMEIAYETEDKRIAVSLLFSYVLKVAGINELKVESLSDTKADYNFPRSFLEKLITDVYATGRVLMSNHIKGTRLEGLFLPFGGAEGIIEHLG